MSEQFNLFVIQVMNYTTGWKNACSPMGGIAAYTERGEADSDCSLYQQMGYAVRVVPFVGEAA